MWRRVIRYKVYIDRARMYFGYAQFIMMLMVMLKVYEDTSFGQWFFSKWWPFPMFIILFFIASVIIGYFDKRYVRPYETTENNKVNTQLMDIHKKIVDESNLHSSGN